MMPLPDDWQMPDPVPPVSVEMLQTAMEVGTNAAAGNGPVPYMLENNPPGLSIENDDGTVTRYRFGDTALNKFLMAIKDLVPLDPDKRMALCLRAWRLMEVIHDRRFKGYVRETESPEMMEYADTLGKVMADIPYRLNNSPKPQEILREVRRRESQGSQSDLFGGG